jgi:hypothetical protein
MSERVFERANQQYGLFAHWCPAEIAPGEHLQESMVHQ